MEHINYIFTTEEEAQLAQLQVDIYYDIPIPNSSIEHWTAYLFDEESEKWIIPYHETLEPVLGPPKI
jgi:hypothetical protein